MGPRGKVIVIALVADLCLACMPSVLPIPTPVPTSPPTPTPVPGITAKEALQAAWESAITECGEERLYLWIAKGGGTVFRKGHGAIEDGRDNDWDITFRRVNPAGTLYTQVYVYIKNNQVDTCKEGGESFKWREEQLKYYLVDLSEEDWPSWIDSPQAVERALAVAEEQGVTGLGAMTLHLTRCSGYGSEPPCYCVNLGPVSGEGGKGLSVWIEAPTGAIYHVAEEEWEPAIEWPSGAD